MRLVGWLRWLVKFSWLWAYNNQKMTRRILPRSFPVVVSVGSMRTKKKVSIRILNSISMSVLAAMVHQLLICNVSSHG